ncbi:MAG: DUF935 family protein [Lentisphaeria bacterium]|nr:DUF935 family protein [Lentisphaeria bacterium]
MQFLKNLFGTGKAMTREEPADRYQGGASYDLTPAKINAIMDTANSGDTREQVQLAAEILEKNADILQALNTRKDAVLGLPWRVQGTDDPRSQKAAEHLENVLRNCGDAYDADSFEELLSDMLNALLPGFAVSEILWEPGGGLRGFRHIPQHHFTFADSFEPLLVTDEEPSGVLLPRERIVYNNIRVHGRDPVRGGLIRPLAWLHCFKHISEKDLLSFIERHGMPFIAAKVDPATYDIEKNKIKQLVRNFGSSGGGVFTRAVELQLLESSYDGGAYFKLLDYLEAAVSKVILGQTASSGDSSGWSKGDAQSQVRQDILESDCAKLMRLVNTQIVKPFVRYNYGSTIPLPRFEIDFTPPQDKEKLANVIKTLYDAGFELSAEDASDLVGIKLSRKAVSPTAAAFAAEAPPSELAAWLGPVMSDKSDWSDQEFDQNLKALADNTVFGSSEALENTIARELLKARREGADYESQN